MNKNESFESVRLFFRGITESDADCLVKWRSDSEIIRYFRNTSPVTIQSHNDWFNNSYLNNNSRFDFIIYDKESNKRIGTVGVNAVNYNDFSCEISYMIAERDFRGKSLAKESVLAVMERIGHYGIRVFRAEIHADNTASIKMIEKLGFESYSKNDNFFVYINTIQ
ncbi:MAG: GNAT family N-acetyltransferase [Oscillospiraceae bacterium]|nr:GNAT family N-acetyltransferase [Oscillospiraceae bacterium]MCL2279540.1 GNAT family N-acetyltransferase [Oscillospiraceae bacterium]